jgi:hypothetical protein
MLIIRLAHDSQEIQVLRVSFVEKDESVKEVPGFRKRCFRNDSHRVLCYLAQLVHGNDRWDHKFLPINGGGSIH